MATQSPLGVDFDGVIDIHPSLRLVRGQRALAQAIVRRLQTPRGGLWYDPTYGTDLRAFLNEALVSVGVVGAAAEAEAEKDERVQRAAATVQWAEDTQTLTVRLALETAEGPFVLSLEVTTLTVKMLSGS